MPREIRAYKPWDGYTFAWVCPACVSKAVAQDATTWWLGAVDPRVVEGHNCTRCGCAL